MIETIRGGLQTRVHARGREAASDDNSFKRDFPHRLEYGFNTVRPELPFGPGLFGEKGQNLPAIAPDIVAYIVLGMNQSLNTVGPVAITIDELERELNDELNTLRRPIFRINSVGQQLGYTGFGGVSCVNILGQRSDADGSKPVGGVRNYMRLAPDRTIPDPSVASGNEPRPAPDAIDILNAKLKAHQEDPPMRLRAGDILLVNNRRAALHWPGTYAEQVLFAGSNTRRSTTIRDGDRVIIRMSFFLKDELPIDSGIDVTTN